MTTVCPILSGGLRPSWSSPMIASKRTSFRAVACRRLMRYSHVIWMLMFFVASMWMLLNPIPYHFSFSVEVARDLREMSYSYKTIDRTNTEAFFSPPIESMEAPNDRTGSSLLRNSQQQEQYAQKAATTTKSRLWNNTKEIVRPDDSNTVLALVAMGRTTDVYIAERCVRSIRARGNFTGHIMLFTDPMGIQKYTYTLSWDPKTIVILGRPDDLEPKHKGNGTKITYRRHTMAYKRFKTLALSYLDFDTRFDHIRYVLYLDVDSIVANKLSRFFGDYYVKISEDYENAKKAIGSDDFSFFSFWKDPGSRFKLWQGGQIMHDRQHSMGCNEAWRHQMDNVWRGMDQPLLMNVANDFKKYKCLVFELPGDGKHFDLLYPEILENARPNRYPTIVHITSARVTNFDQEPQQKFIRKALLLNDKDHDEGGTHSMMIGNITWNDVTTPVGAGGESHNQLDEK